MKKEIINQEEYYNKIKRLNIAHYTGEIPYYSKESLRKVEREILTTLKPGTFLLDLGCGSGRFSIGATQMGFNVIGVDIAAKVIEASKQRAKQLNIANVKFLCADMTKLPFKDNVFDYVFCPRFSINALATFNMRKNAINEMLRVVKDGGMIFVESFNKFYLGDGFILLFKNITRDFLRYLFLLYCYVIKKPYIGLLPGDITYKANKVAGASEGYTHLPSIFELIKLMPKHTRFKFYSIPQINKTKSFDLLKFFRYSIWIFITKSVDDQ